ncbi:unknown [Bacteroides sp. CAG:661]|nr:unknown [Bacteroides sp. CAG:661]
MLLFQFIHPKLTSKTVSHIGNNTTPYRMGTANRIHPLIYI